MKCENENTARRPGMFPPLNLPDADLRIAKDGNGKLKVFDKIRKKYVALTPEEFVRQRFVEWLTNTLNYPSALIANEIGIELNSTHRRCDTVVFRSNGEPLMIIEYKAPGITVSQEVFDQIIRYNMVLKARYLVVSNGFMHYCCVIDYDHATYAYLPEIPDYPTLLSSIADN